MEQIITEKEFDNIIRILIDKCNTYNHVMEHQCYTNSSIYVQIDDIDISLESPDIPAIRDNNTYIVLGKKIYINSVLVLEIKTSDVRDEGANYNIETIKYAEGWDDKNYYRLISNIIEQLDNTVSSVYKDLKDYF